MATANFFIKPEDGWVEVAPQCAYVRIRQVSNNQAIYVTSSETAPSDDDIGFRIECEEFYVDTMSDGPYYVRCVNPHADVPLRIDVLYLGEAGSGGGGTPVTPAAYEYLGYEQLDNSDLSAVTTLTVPAGTRVVVAQNNGSTAGVRFAIGENPSSTYGQIVYPGQNVTFNLSETDLEDIRVIRTESDSALTFDVMYYG